MRPAGTRKLIGHRGLQNVPPPWRPLTPSGLPHVRWPSLALSEDRDATSSAAFADLRGAVVRPGQGLVDDAVSQGERPRLANVRCRVCGCVDAVIADADSGDGRGSFRRLCRTARSREPELEVDHTV